MIWLAKTVNDRLNVVETLRFQTVKKRFACVSVDMKNAVTTVGLPTLYPSKKARQLSPAHIRH